MSRSAFSHTVRFVALASLLVEGRAQADAPPVDFARQVMPLVERYCVSCHGAAKKKGDLLLDGFRAQDDANADAGAEKDMHVWQLVAERLIAREMPPDDQAQPTADERGLILSWIEQAQRRAPPERPDPGRVTIRRLNRAEYDNTIRDLLGVDLQAAKDFPSDDVGYGFDNIGDVLSMPPVLVEKYMTAAERIAERAIVADVGLGPRSRAFEIARLAPSPSGSFVRDGALVLTGGRPVRVTYDFRVRGMYSFAVKAAGRSAGGDAPWLALRIDGKPIQSLEVIARRASLQSIHALVAPGRHQVELALENPQTGPTPARQLALESLRIDEPHDAEPMRLPKSHTRIIPFHPSPDQWRQAARDFLTDLGSRAYRRPIEPAELQRLTALVERTVEAGETFERGMQMALRALLVSPHFLFRVELDPGTGQAHPVTDDQLASRLSYFLWSSLPDDELLRLAAHHALHEPVVLAAQVRRMLADDKARALVENFAPQWLQIRNLATARPARKIFPAFDDELRAAMVKETEMFFATVMRNDLEIDTFLDGDFTFLNERLARHYGISGIKGPAFRRVSLTGSPRGGVLTQASVLTVTSNPTRTSPVKRGRWVLEQLLGTPPPPPPPGVPELPEPTKNHPVTVGLRERMAQHRRDPSCANCHKKMDPLGFGLENFDAVGAWRTTDESGLAVDPSGTLPDGSSFSGPAELRAVLKKKARAFRRSLATKLLTYALGRGAESFDRVAIDRICEESARNHNRFSSLVIAIVTSDPFLMRREEVIP